MKVRIEFHGPAESASGPEEIAVTESAERAVRFTFNPSGFARVNRLKALAAAFISECEGARNEVPEGAREFAVAITNMQTASMWAVLAATTNAPPR